MEGNVHNDDIISKDDDLFSSVGMVKYYSIATKEVSGVYVKDHNGNEYLDFLSSAAVNIGVDLGKDREKKKERGNDKKSLESSYRAWEEGLLVTLFSGNILRIQPPLTLTKKEVGEGIRIIEESIMELENNQIPDKVLDNIDGW